MAKIRVDGKEYEVKEGDNLLDACLSLGLDLPYFCWHPELGSVGACRQCAVIQYQDDNDEKGKLVMSCMTAVRDGARFSIEDKVASGFRANVIEWLMTNHPHDCPVCEEGGECHLQDMTQMTGHTYRRYRYKKRTFRNQELGPFIGHEMNRCITCYRCVRFYRDYAGGHDLDSFGAHNHVYFGRQTDGTLENEFSGNLVEICPTGVFTDKTLSDRYTRKWDLRGAPSVCHGCSVGCNTIVNERYGVIKRMLNRYNGAVNGYFICDRGRFGYEYTNADSRVRQPLTRSRRDTDVHAVDQKMALERLSEMLGNANGIQAIGSPRASLESNYALRHLAGRANFSNGLSAGDSRLVGRAAEILRDSGLRSASLHDVEMSDAVFILGEDLINTAPRLGLSIRQAARQKAMQVADTLGVPRWHDNGLRQNVPRMQSPVFLATPAATKMDDCSTQTFRLEEAEIARLGYAVAHELDADMPAVEGLSIEARQQAGSMAEALREAKYPLVVSGTSIGSEAVLRAAAAVAQALSGKAGKEPRISLVVPEANSMGVALMGGTDVETALNNIIEGKADTLIVLENDLYRRVSGDMVDRALEKAHQVMVLDHTRNTTLDKADLVLPTATFAEGTGTLVNNEGRAQRFFNVIPPEGHVANAWRWVGHLLQLRNGANPWPSLDVIVRECAEVLPVFAGMEDAAPDEHYRSGGGRLARAPHRYSGRTSMDANKSVHEPVPAHDPDTPMTYTMEGQYGRQASSTFPFFWSPGWNSEQSLNKFQDEVGGRMRGGDPGVRLIEPAQEIQPQQPAGDDIPGPFKPHKNEVRLVPLHHLFGSDWLSAISPGIAERAPDEPYLALNAAAAEQMGVEEGQTLALETNGARQRLKLRIVPSLPDGTAGLPVGLSSMPYEDLPGWGRVSAEDDTP